MANTALEIIAFVVSISGWLLVSSTVPTDYWKVSTNDGTVITTATFWANLWKTCVTDSTGVSNCKDFPSMLALDGLHPLGPRPRPSLLSGQPTGAPAGLHDPGRDPGRDPGPPSSEAGSRFSPRSKGAGQRPRSVTCRPQTSVLCGRLLEPGIAGWLVAGAGGGGGAAHRQAWTGWEAFGCRGWRQAVLLS